MVAFHLHRRVLLFFTLAFPPLVTAATHQVAFARPNYRLARQVGPRSSAVDACRAQQRNETISDVQGDFMDTFLTIPEPRLLILDVVAIAIAAQLMGLVDVLNNPVFWQNGGWLQGVTGMPSTLSTLVQRQSILSICWILSALITRGYQSESSGTKEDFFSLQLRISRVFSLLRVLTALAGAFLVPSMELDALDLIRQCYITILMVGFFRFLYIQLYR